MQPETKSPVREQQPVPPVSAWLAAELRARGMTQGQLARRAGMSRSTVSRLVSGEHLPSLDTIAKLARALPGLLASGATPHYLDSTGHPAARVEYALRMDGVLSKKDVQQVMNFYLSKRRAGRTVSVDEKHPTSG